MDAELTRVTRIRRELEPLAYIFERFQTRDFQICYDLHKEYLALERSLQSSLGD